ncbi:hypothetical protein BD847_0713 [Flavobacterium cutihirudinis]|uniref:Uncharacterized protein n=1 Tax=Flavobacterium cutihirudinis TaxID=1265740 RepID=A0A3D9G0P5_9FLAO|nr:hypothetical protein [Flavobacterium cutihirudinis]RED26788.1 hypothetical protein BD847_0713 [Flavobacterium cutihirudinis]
MRSKLSVTEFRARLKNNTEIGSVKVKLSSFRIFPRFGGSKPFYGHFDDTDFRLTLNSELSPTIFVIKGKYKSVDSALKLDYIVEANSKFQSIWVEYSPIVLIVAINLFFLFFGKGLRKASTIVNLFLLFMAFYSRWKANRRKKKLEQKFLKIFEIIK